MIEVPIPTPSLCSMLHKTDACVFEKFSSFSSKTNYSTHLNVITSQRQVIILRPLLDADLLWPSPLLLFPYFLQGIDDWGCVIYCILIDLHLHMFGRSSTLCPDCHVLER